MAQCSWERFFKTVPNMGILDGILVGIDEIPGVIDREMIVDSFYETSRPEFKYQMNKEDVLYEDIEKLNLESKNILKIDHLWMLENLTVLSLAHNGIRIMENLEELKNLKELNLSYNRIKIMEGLEGLLKLEVAIFHGNEISYISGLLDQEFSLRILSVSMNKITDNKCIIYLQRFKNIVSLNMDGNPVADKPFKERVYAFLPDLVYYNNHFITEAERNESKEVLHAELKEKEDLEESKGRYMKKLLAHKRKLEFSKRAFIDGLDKNEFFHKMFRKDADGRAFKDDTDRFEDVYDRLRARCFEVSIKISEAGANNLTQRLEEVAQFKRDTVTNARSGQKRLIQATAKVSSKINALLSQAKNYFQGPMTKQLKKDEASLQMWLQGLQMLREFVNHYLDDQLFHLMSVEMKNFEKNEETVNNYDCCLSEVITVFIEELQSQFTRLRDAENDCHEEISNRLVKLMNEAHQKDELGKLPQSFRERMVDRESLHNSIDSSHDLHLLAIDTKEDSIVSRLRMWHKQQTGELLKNEMLHNRKVVLEIHNYINNQKKEFEQQICGILNFFKFLEPDEDLEENLDTIIKQWLSSKKKYFEIPTLEDPVIVEKNESTNSDIFDNSA